MANPERGELALTVGDRTYTLVTDFDAICQIEQRMSYEDGRIVPMLECYLAAAQGSYRHLRAVVWGALRRHHKELTIEHVGTLIEEFGGPEAFLKVVSDLRKVSEPEGSARPRKARQSGKAGATTTSTRVA